MFTISSNNIPEQQSLVRTAYGVAGGHLGQDNACGHLGQDNAGGHLGQDSAGGHLGQENAGGHLGQDSAGGHLGQDSAGGHLGQDSAGGHLGQDNAGGNLGQDNAGGHLGQDKALMKLKERYYWPGHWNDVQDWCNACAACISRKSVAPKPRASLQPIFLKKANLLQLTFCYTMDGGIHVPNPKSRSNHGSE